MDYLVIARKYRPQTFTEVAGQHLISRTLSRAISKGRIAHGFLFTGPSGVGKTTMARILAKALSCEQGVSDTPCGVCDHCRMIADSHHPDVYEIDAATNNSVNDVRELAEGAMFAPTQSRFRIYILDEVHMLSTSAWNALLKLIEEPPEHVYFIFATTEIEKVPATVVNRCQRYDFRAIGHDDIVARLGEVCAAEGIAIDPALLGRIARAAKGGMRDAQTMLDQLIAMCNDDTIAAADLDLLLGAAGGEDLHALISQLLNGDTAAALATIEKACSGGVAADTLISQLTDNARTLLLAVTCGADAEMVRAAGPLDEDLIQAATRAGTDKLLRVVQILGAANQASRHGGDARLQVELAAVRISRIGELLDVEGLLRRIERMERSMSAGGSSSGHPR
ncbi:MAG: DNA polymerase III subunit gamma/tau [Planctomycetota bacterium]